MTRGHSEQERERKGTVTEQVLTRELTCSPYFKRSSRDTDHFPVALQS